jgi:hypothetical protein
MDTLSVEYVFSDIPGLPEYQQQGMDISFFQTPTIPPDMIPLT